MRQLYIFGDQTCTQYNTDINPDNHFNFLSVVVESNYYSSLPYETEYLLTYDGYVNHMNLLDAGLSYYMDVDTYHGTNGYEPNTDSEGIFDIQNATRYYTNNKFHGYDYIYKYMYYYGHYAKQNPDWSPDYCVWIENLNNFLSHQSDNKLVKGTDLKLINLRNNKAVTIPIPIDLLKYNIYDNSINPYVSYISIVKRDGSWNNPTTDLNIKLYINDNDNIITNAIYRTTYTVPEFTGGVYNLTSNDVRVNAYNIYYFNISTYQQSSNTIYLYPSIQFKMSHYIWSYNDNLFGNVDLVIDTTKLLDNYDGTAQSDYPYPFVDPITNTGISVFNSTNDEEYKYQIFNLLKNKGLKDFTYNASSIISKIPTLSKRLHKNDNEFTNYLFFVHPDNLVTTHTYISSNSTNSAEIINLPSFNTYIRTKTDLTKVDSFNQSYDYQPENDNYNYHDYTAIPVAIVTCNTHDINNNDPTQTIDKTNDPYSDKFSFRIIGYLVISEIHYHILDGVSSFTDNNPSPQTLIDNYQYIASKQLRTYSEIMTDNTYYDEFLVSNTSYKFNNEGLLYSCAYSYSYSYSYSYAYGY